MDRTNKLASEVRGKLKGIRCHDNIRDGYKQ